MRVPSAATPPGAGSGKCPGCDAFGSLVEEAPAAATANGGCQAAASPRRRQRRGGEAHLDRRSRARPRSRRRACAGVPRAGRRRAGRRQVDAPAEALGAIARRTPRAARHRRGVDRPGEAARRAARRDGGGGVLAETELEAVCATLEGERPDVCVIDSVQTLYSADSAPRRAPSGRCARRRVGCCESRRSSASRPPRRPRDEGRRRRGAARARAPRRLRAPVRGRPLPRTSRPARDEEPVRLDERARRLRDDGRGARRRPRSSELFGQRPGEIGAAVACALEGTRPILLEIQALVAPTDLAMPRRVATGVDPKRLAMIVAVLSRHAGVALGRPTSSSTSRGACGSTSPGRTSPSRSRSPRPRAGGRPRRLAAFGEIGLTGRLRPADAVRAPARGMHEARDRRRRRARRHAPRPQIGSRGRTLREGARAGLEGGEERCP